MHLFRTQGTVVQPIEYIIFPTCSFSTGCVCLNLWNILSSHCLFHLQDSLDHDESSAERVAPAMAEVREEGDISSVVRQTTATEAKLQTTSEVIVGSPLNISSNLKTFDDPIDDEKDTSFTFQNASSLCTTSQQETIDSAPTHSFEDKDLPEKQSDPSVFSFGNNVSPRQQPNASSTLLDVGNKVASLAESRAASENGNKVPYTQCNAASSYSDVQESVFLNAHTSSNHKLDRSCRLVCSSSFSIQKCSLSAINWRNFLKFSFGYEWVGSLFPHPPFVLFIH